MAAQYDREMYKLKAELCKVFADPTRLVIIHELRGGEKAAGSLVETLGVPQSVVSRHLALLRNRGVVKSRREGTNIYYRLTDPKIGEACDIVHTILLNQVAKSRELADRLMS